MTTQTLEITKFQLIVEKITEEQIRQEGRDYNASEWDDIITRFAGYGKTTFYKALPQRGYAYTRYYAAYTIEGINLFKEVSYISCMTNSGFAIITIDNKGNLYRTLCKDGNGNYGYCSTDKTERAIMAKNSKVFGTIYSKEF